MHFSEYIVDVNGPDVSNGRRSPEAIGSVLKWIEPFVRGAASMAFRYTSAARGRPPEWFTAATNIRFSHVSHREGYIELGFEAPRLGEAAKEVYQQQEMAELDIRPDKDETAFGLALKTLRDIDSGKKDSPRFDTRLLQRVGRVSESARRWGVSTFTFHDNKADEPEVILDRRLSETAKELQLETPRPQRVRVAGQLDMIRASDGSFGLLLPDGQALHGLVEEILVDRLSDYWRRQIVMEGMAFFRPSGSVLRLEANAVDLARETDDFFAVMPEPISSGYSASELRRPQTSKTGLAQAYGAWPGDETEEELLAALEDAGA